MTKRRSIDVAAFVVLLATPLRAHGTPANYELVGNRCQIVAHLLKGGIAAGLAHDHVVRAKVVTGTVRFDSGQVEATQMRVIVPTRSLEVDDPALRRRYKLGSKLDAEQRREVLDNLRAKDQLHVAKYRRISFRATKVRRAAPGRLRVTGKLEIRGVERTVSFDAGIRATDRLLRASAAFEIKQSDFGYQPYSAGLGTVRVKDRLTLNIYLVARRQDGT